MLLRDPQGVPIPAGRVRRELTETFLPDRTATWLEMPDGAAGRSLGPGSAHYYAVGNAAGGQCGLRSSFDIDLATVEQLELWIDGLHTSDATVAAELSFKDLADPPGRGVGVWNPANAARLTYRAFGAGQPDRLIDYTWGGAEAARRRNVALILRPRSREVYLCSDDQVIWSVTDPSIVNTGTVRACYEAPQAGNAGEVRLAQLRLVVVHN